MSTGTKNFDMQTNVAKILSAKGGLEDELPACRASIKTNRRELLRATTAMAMAGTLTALAGWTRPAAAQPIGPAGRDFLLDKRPVLREGGTPCGVYDPHGDFSQEARISTEHLFLPWEDVDFGSIANADKYARDRGRKMLITIEPCSWVEYSASAVQLRDLILGGQRDANMRAILSALSEFRSPLIIRWGHEMESTTSRFPWQSWAPEDYVAAYRRMAEITREILPDAQLMWSPKGQTNLGRYYPGDDLVELVGLSVFGLQEFDEIEYGRPRTFAESLRQGYELSVGFKKPIWVAELGYEGKSQYVTSWAEDVTRVHDEFAALQEVVYFNSKEVYPWPHQLGLPDWRVIRNDAI